MGEQECSQRQTKLVEEKQMGLGEPAFWLPSVGHKDPMKVLEGGQITSVLQRSWAGRDAGTD